MKELTEKEYNNYMETIDRYIRKSETIINDLPKFKDIRQLSFEEWIKFQNGELNNK
jgi:hypothetical protein